MPTDLSQFKCLRCGSCCRQPGYVRLKKDEPDRIASFLHMDIYNFTEKYTCLTKDRQTLSLIENEDHSCIFLSSSGCRINPVKPGQCRQFPHQWKFKDFNNICRWARTTAGLDKSPLKS